MTFKRIAFPMVLIFLLSLSPAALGSARLLQQKVKEPPVNIEEILTNIDASTLTQASTTVQVPAIADIALAGQPPGLTINVGCGRDTAPINSPIEILLNSTPGQAIQFTSVTGTVGVDILTTQFRGQSRARAGSVRNRPDRC